MLTGDCIVIPSCNWSCAPQLLAGCWGEKSVEKTFLNIGLTLFKLDLLLLFQISFDPSICKLSFLGNVHLHKI